MSKRTYISRYNLIINKLKLKPYSSFKEIQDYIENKMEHLRDEADIAGFSLRTFQRDMRELRGFGIDIEYSKQQKGYHITSDIDNMNFQRMMESFDTFQSLNLASAMSAYIHLEIRPPQATENLYGLLHAIKNKFEIRFAYQTFDNDGKIQKTVNPYALKEFRNRWYLIAKDSYDNTVKSFALDFRLSDLEISQKKYEMPKEYNVEEHYRYSFGIVGPNDNDPQEIILSFTSKQGKYITTLPLHDTQEILINDKNELRIKLFLHISFDFIMQLLSYGDAVKVLEPISLANEIKETLKSALVQYG